jgi:hypothetical protein
VKHVLLTDDALTVDCVCDVDETVVSIVVVSVEAIVIVALLLVRDVVVVLGGAKLSVLLDIVF